MTRIQPGRGRRGAFTLTELLVVILIIAVLVSLTAAGVLKIMGQGPQLKTSSEIRQFEVAFQQFFQEYDKVNYVPSYLVLREDNNYDLKNPAEVNSLNFLKRMFGKSLNTNASPGQLVIDWNGNGQFDGRLVLEGQHCLTFFLGGIPAPSPPNSANSCLGFSTNPQNPATSGGTRRGPFYQNFEASRLRLDSNGFFKYWDAWPAKSVATPRQPYAFFSAYGVPNGYPNSWGILDQNYNKQPPPYGDCKSLLPGIPGQLAAAGGGGPYFSKGTLTTFANPNTYQIISAGKDNTFGVGANWSPGGGGTVPPNGADSDNQTNFTKGILESGQ